MSQRRDDNYFIATRHLNEYEKAYNWYVEDCIRDNEETIVDLTTYMRIVPLSQVEQMINVYKL